MTNEIGLDRSGTVAVWAGLDRTGKVVLCCCSHRERDQVGIAGAMRDGAGGLSWKRTICCISRDQDHRLMSAEMCDCTASQKNDDRDAEAIGGGSDTADDAFLRVESSRELDADLGTVFGDGWSAKRMALLNQVLSRSCWTRITISRRVVWKFEQELATTSQGEHM